MILRLENLSKRRRMSRTEETIGHLVKVTPSYLRSLDSVRTEIKAISGLNVSRSLLFREGALQLAETLRVQCRKAAKGRLHGKIRKDH